LRFICYCVCRDKESFGKDGAAEKIVQIRYQHYEEKRKAKIKTL
jgi:hypothetical protein